MRRLMMSAVLLGLASCGTPQQQCIGQVTQNLRVMDSLIAETQGNLARGYALVPATRSVPEFVDCTPRPTEQRPNPRHKSCLVNTAQTYTRPAAIDLNAEAAKLASLQSRRQQMAAAVNPSVLACQQQYPAPAP